MDGQPDLRQRRPRDPRSTTDRADPRRRPRPSSPRRGPTTSTARSTPPPARWSTSSSSPPRRPRSSPRSWARSTPSADASGKATFRVADRLGLARRRDGQGHRDRTSPAVTTLGLLRAGRRSSTTPSATSASTGTPIPTTQAGNSVTYLFTVTNDGSDLDSGGTLTVTLPSMTQFAASSPYDPKTLHPALRHRTPRGSSSRSATSPRVPRSCSRS